MEIPQTAMALAMTKALRGENQRKGFQANQNSQKNTGKYQHAQPKPNGGQR